MEMEFHILVVCISEDTLRIFELGVGNGKTSELLGDDVA